MWITRKIGKLLRGRVTPFQVVSACLLGTWLGFVPGFAQGPGWTALLAATLLVLNANLGLALLTLGIAKAEALALAGPTFEVGRFLLDGPTRGLFRAVVEAPVTAWFGFEHYLTAGGVVVGLVLGLAHGLVVHFALRAFRRRMAALERDSERFAAWSSKRWVRAVVFVVAGKQGRGKKSYEDLMAKKVGLPVRPVGIAVVAGAVAVAFLVRGLVAQPIVTEAVRSELARANGATVDVDSVELDLAGGSLAVRGLALCDPDDLGRDLLRAAELTADVDVEDLLRRRFTFERVVVRGARTGAQRATPGVLVGPAPPAVEAPEETAPEDEERTLEDVLEDARVWKERLADAREKLERILNAGGEGGDDGETADDDASIEERAQRDGRERVVSRGLLARVPALTVREVVLEGLAGLGAGTVDVQAYDLSTHPALLAADPRLEVRTPDGSFELSLSVDADHRGAGRVALRTEGLDLGRLARGLRAGGAPLVEGGTLDLALDGGWSGGLDDLDLPLALTLRDTTVRVGGEAVPVDELSVPVSLRGALDAPRFHVDVSELRDRALAAGKERLQRELLARKEALQAEALERLNEVRADVEQRVDEARAEVTAQVDEARAKAEAELAAAQARAEAEAAQAKAEAEAQLAKEERKAKKALEKKLAEEAAKAAAKKGLGGILGPPK